MIEPVPPPLLEEIKPFLTARGLVLPYPARVMTDSRLKRFREVLTPSCLYFILLYLKGIRTQSVMQSFSDLMLYWSQEPGLLILVPDPREIAAVATAAYLTDYSVALSILNYGQNVKVRIYRWLSLHYFYNPINPGRRFSDPYNPLDPKLGDQGNILWRGWLGRYPWLIAHLEFSAWRAPKMALKICWLAKYLTTRDRLLAGLLALSARGNSRLCDLAIQLRPVELARETQKYLPEVHPVSSHWPLTTTIPRKGDSHG